MALSSWGIGTSSSSLRLSTHPSRQGSSLGFAALMPASLCSQGSAAARFAMWGCRELPSPTTCPRCCQVSHVGIHSSQGCSDKPCSPAELGELSPGPLPWQLTGRAIQHLLGWAQGQMLDSLGSIGHIFRLLIQLRVHSFSGKNRADAMRQVRQAAVMQGELFCKV